MSPYGAVRQTEIEDLIEIASSTLRTIRSSWNPTSEFKKMKLRVFANRVEELRAVKLTSSLPLCWYWAFLKWPREVWLFEKTLLISLARLRCLSSGWDHVHKWWKTAQSSLTPRSPPEGVCALSARCPRLRWAGLGAVREPSQTCQQKQGGLNTSTRWSSKMAGCTHPRAGDNLSHKSVEQWWKAPCCPDFLTSPVTPALPRPEADHSHVSRLTAQCGSSRLPKLSLPSLQLPRLSLQHLSQPRGCTQSHTFAVRQVSSTRPAGCLTLACCFPSELWPSLGELNATRKCHWGNKSVVRAYWSATFVSNVKKEILLFQGWHQALATVGLACLKTPRWGALELTLQIICLLQEELKEPGIH